MKVLQATTVSLIYLLLMTGLAFSQSEWEVPHCLKAIPERLEDGTYLVWVDAVNPADYTVFDGMGYLYFEKQPIPLNELKTEVVYKVMVGDDDVGCNFQAAGSFVIRIPFISN